MLQRPTEVVIVCNYEMQTVYQEQKLLMASGKGAVTSRRRVNTWSSKSQSNKFKT